ncbi:hypothetical protein BG004_006749 [Podila humilis]|nr:hypothetical protein BG004_006749 [Podila humilis]
MEFLHLSTLPSSTKVLNIPELRSNVATYLTRSDLLNLLRTCRTWLEIWYPEIFTTTTLTFLPSTEYLAQLEHYGQHIRSLSLAPSRCGGLISCTKILKLAPKVYCMSLSMISKTPSAVDAHCPSSAPSSSSSAFSSHNHEISEILDAAPKHLCHLSITMAPDTSLFKTKNTRTSRRMGPSEIVSHSDCFIRMIRFHNLRSLVWTMNRDSVVAATARRRQRPIWSVQIDSILNLLRNCRSLSVLAMESVEILDSDENEPVEEEDQKHNKEKVVDKSSVIMDKMKKINPMAPGRGLRSLKLGSCSISGMSLLRILSIDHKDICINNSDDDDDGDASNNNNNNNNNVHRITSLLETGQTQPHALVELKLDLLPVGSGRTLPSNDDNPILHHHHHQDLQHVAVCKVLQNCPNITALQSTTYHPTTPIQLGRLAQLLRETHNWACASTLRHLNLYNKGPVDIYKNPQQYGLSVHDRALYRTIKASFKNLPNLTQLSMVGYPFGFEFVDDDVAEEGKKEEAKIGNDTKDAMRFLPETVQRVLLTVETPTPWDYTQEGADAQLIMQGSRWLEDRCRRFGNHSATNGQNHDSKSDWSCRIDRGPPVRFWLDYELARESGEDAIATMC